MVVQNKKDLEDEEKKEVKPTLKEKLLKTLQGKDLKNKKEFEEELEQLPDNPKDLEMQLRALLSSEKQLFENVEDQYNFQVENMALAKQSQAERLLERLDKVCEAQEKKVQKLKEDKPKGFVSKAKKEIWQKKVNKEEKRLSQLNKRRKRCRRIFDDMKEVQRLGAAKVRFYNPILAGERDEALKAERIKALEASEKLAISSTRQKTRGRTITREY